MTDRQLDRTACLASRPSGPCSSVTSLTGSSSCPLGDASGVLIDGRTVSRARNYRAVNISSFDDEAASSSANKPRVLWWRDGTGDVEVPRGHGVGWATEDGAQHGRLTLVSDHLRLDASQIMTRLADELGAADLEQLDHVSESVSPAVRLYAAGHVVAELDLADLFGKDCAVGVAVELRGRGVAARIAHQPGLSQAERDAALLWAEAKIDEFGRASRESALEAMGWTQMAPSRWQITAAGDEIIQGHSISNSI